MPSTSDPTPLPSRRLRLAGDVEPSQRPPSSADDARARSDRLRQDRQAHHAWEVGAENRAASGISTFDARWIMAARVSDALEGGRAAILRPEARTRLVSSATRMGLRPFDANMVIAIVQDAARRGRQPLDDETTGRLTLVGPAATRSRRGPAWLMLLGAAIAVAWGAAILRWLIG